MNQAFPDSSYHPSNSGWNHVLIHSRAPSPPSRHASSLPSSIPNMDRNINIVQGYNNHHRHTRMTSLCKAGSFYQSSHLEWGFNHTWDLYWNLSLDKDGCSVLSHSLLGGGRGCCSTLYSSQSGPHHKYFSVSLCLWCWVWELCASVPGISCRMVWALKLS